MKFMAIALFVLIPTILFSQDELTGCLSNGTITRIAVGSEPSQPCTGNSIPVTWNKQGPMGDTGDTGETGAPGPTGLQGPAGENGKNGERYELAGFTSQERVGYFGVITRNMDCASDVDPLSRVCTSVEIMETANPITPPRTMWVRPVIVATDGNGNQVDATGAAAESLFCQRDSAGGLDPFGLAFFTDGSFSPERCTAEYATACCAPVQ